MGTRAEIAPQSHKNPVGNTDMFGLVFFILEKWKLAGDFNLLVELHVTNVLVSLK